MTYTTSFTIIHPLIKITEEGIQNGLVLFDYLVDIPKTGKPKVRYKDQRVLVLPSQEEMESCGLSFANNLHPNANSLYLRNEDPILTGDDSRDLVGPRKSLVKKIKELLQHSPSYQP